MKFTLEEVDSSWRYFFTTHLEEINGIVGSIDGEAMAPERSKVFRAFQYPLNEVKVLIVGQDPYPGFGIADGLAFSSARGSPRIFIRNLNLISESWPLLRQTYLTGVTGE